MELKSDILRGLVLHLESQKATAKVCLDNYLYNSMGIGEHPDIMVECVKLIEKIDQADSALITLHKSYQDELQG